MDNVIFFVSCIGLVFVVLGVMDALRTPSETEVPYSPWMKTAKPEEF